MRIALISDIHGNCFALDAALADLQSHAVDQIICLGDTLQGGAQPAETAKRLQALACPIVMGNADAWLLAEENDTAESTTEQQREVRLWTLSQLSADDLAFMRSFQPNVEIALEERLLLGPYAPAIMTGGHTHTQQMRRVGEGLFFNPGSIGLAYNIFLPEDQFHLDAWAEYAILTAERGCLRLDFHRVPYNVEQLIQIIRSSGRMHANQIIAEYQRAN